MRRIALLAVCVLLAGCEYVTPLVKSPEKEIDKRVLGLWERRMDDGRLERLLVLPLGQKEYLVSFPSNSEDAMFARGCLCEVAGRMIVQLEWFGTAKGKLPKEDRVFQFATYSFDAESMKVSMLNSDIVGKDVKTSEDMKASIENAKDNPALFKDERNFVKVKD